MPSKYNRDNFYQSNEVNGIKEQDLVRNYWELFEVKRPMRYFTVTRSYLARPDLLSMKLYSRMDYWWIIAKLNTVDDWWNDIEIEDVLQVPDLADIEEFYSKVRSAKRRGV